MTLYTNTGEGGTSGTTVTTANSGGVSGDAWSSISGTITYQAVQAAHGSIGYQATGSGAVNYFRWDLGANSDLLSLRFYLRLSAAVTAATNVVDIRNATSSTAGQIIVNGTNRLNLTIAGPNSVWTSTDALPTGTPIRVEVALNKSTNQYRIAYFLGDSTTAVEDSGWGTPFTFSNQYASLRFGKNTSSAITVAFGFDDLVADNTRAALLGPVVTSEDHSGSLSLSGTGALTLAGKPSVAGTAALTGTGTLALSGMDPNAGKLYFPSSGAAGATPAFGTPWSVTNSAGRGRLSGSKTDTLLTDFAAAETTANAFTNVLVRHYLSDPLAADTVISGTFSAVMQAKESDPGADSSLQIAVIVWTPANTQRGVLYSGHGVENSASVGALGQEFDTTFSTRIIPETVMSSVSALAGDRIAVAVGSRNRNAVTSTVTTTLKLGDPLAAPDFDLTPGVTTSGTPWVRFTPALNLTNTFTVSFSGSVDLTASGALSLSGKASTAASLGLTSTGSLSLSGRAALASSLSLSGTASLDLSGKAAVKGAVAFTGTGALALAGAPAVARALSLTSSGALVTEGVPSPADTLALGATGVLTLDHVNTAIKPYHVALQVPGASATIPTRKTYSATLEVHQ